MAERLTMTIDGRPATASGTMAVRNPADGQVFATVPDAGETELDAAVEAAARVFPRWRDAPWEERRAAIEAIGRTIADNLGALAQMLVREQGKPLERPPRSCSGRRS